MIEDAKHRKLSVVTHFDSRGQPVALTELLTRRKRFRSHLRLSVMDLIPRCPPLHLSESRVAGGEILLKCLLPGSAIVSCRCGIVRRLQIADRPYPGPRRRNTYGKKCGTKVDT